MIRDAARLATAAVVMAACAADVARAEDARAEDARASKADADVDARVDTSIDTSIDRHRSPVEALTEGMIGSASRPVRFDWRTSAATFGVIGSSLIELNNFQSGALGIYGAKAFGDVKGEVSLTWVDTQGSESTARLALTPYRQAGRPHRLELAANVGYPLAEGVVTPVVSWLPPAEMALFAVGGVRYLAYPWALGGLPAFSLTEASIGTALVAPTLTDREVENLEGDRLPGMEIDRGRYGALTGLELDVWFQPGVVVEPRAMIALPLMSVAGSKLGWWWELSLSVGFAL